MLLSIWEVLKEPVLAGVFGLFVGIYVHARKNNKKIIKPRKLKGSWDLGFLYDCMESAFGAFSLVLISAPSDIVRVMVIALLGAYNADKINNYLVRLFNNATIGSIDKSLDKKIEPEDDEKKDAK